MYSSDGENLGRVVKALAAPNIDMFDGIVFDTTAGPAATASSTRPRSRGSTRTASTLKIDAAAASNLPKPGANPGAIRASAADFAGEASAAPLGRFWDRLSGKG